MIIDKKLIRKIQDDIGFNCRVAFDIDKTGFSFIAIVSDKNMKEKKIMKMFLWNEVFAFLYTPLIIENFIDYAKRQFSAL